MSEQDGLVEVERFAWVPDVIGDAGCVTLVETTDVEEAVRAFGGRMDEAQRMPWEEVGRAVGGDPAVAVRQYGRWVIGVERNGFQGSRPEVLRRAAAGGLPWETDDDADWGDADWVGLMFALAARVTGQTVTPEWLEGEFTVVPIMEWAPDVVEKVYPECQSVTYEEPTLGYALRVAEDAALRRVVAVEFGEPRRNQQRLMHALSVDTMAVAAHWSGRGDALFYYVVDGRIQTSFRARSPDIALGDAPRALKRHIAKLQLPVRDAATGTQEAPGLLALAQRLTGLAVEPESLDTPHLLVPLSGL